MANNWNNRLQLPTEYRAMSLYQLINQLGSLASRNDDACCPRRPLGVHGGGSSILPLPSPPAGPTLRRRAHGCPRSRACLSVRPRPPAPLPLRRPRRAREAGGPLLLLRLRHSPPPAARARHRSSRWPVPRAPRRRHRRLRAVRPLARRPPRRGLPDDDDGGPGRGNGAAAHVPSLRGLRAAARAQRQRRRLRGDLQGVVRR